MTEAFECDRCGELQGNPPEIRLATNAAEQAAGVVNLKEKTRDTRRRVGTLATPQPARNTTYEIIRGDLCESCAEAFREFWGVDDE